MLFWWDEETAWAAPLPNFIRQATTGRPKSHKCDFCGAAPPQTASAAVNILLYLTSKQPSELIEKHLLYTSYTKYSRFVQNY